MEIHGEFNFKVNKYNENVENHDYIRLCKKILDRWYTSQYNSSLQQSLEKLQ